jgi:hypothetical protein
LLRSLLTRALIEMPLAATRWRVKFSNMTRV